MNVPELEPCAFCEEWTHSTWDCPLRQSRLDGISVTTLEIWWERVKEKWENWFANHPTSLYEDTEPMYSFTFRQEEINSWALYINPLES